MIEDKQHQYISWPGSAAFATEDAAKWAFEVTAQINRMIKYLDEQSEKEQDV